MKNIKSKVFTILYFSLMHTVITNAMEKDPEPPKRKAGISRSSHVISTRKRTDNIKKNTVHKAAEAAMSSEDVMRFYVPIPRNIHHLKTAKKFIKEYDGLPDEYGRNYLSYALDLTISDLFESKLPEDQQKSTTHIPLPKDIYWRKRSRLIALLFSQPSSTFMLKSRDRSNPSKSPLDYFVSSLALVMTQEQADDYKRGSKTYLPVIFNTITEKHGDLLGKILYNSDLSKKNIRKIKKRLSSFPIYLKNIDQADRYLKKLKRKAIDKQDHLQKTWAHYALCLTNKSILRNYSLEDHHRIIEKLLKARPDLSIEDTTDRTPLSEFFNSILTLYPRLDLTPKTPRTSYQQRQSNDQDQADLIFYELFNTLVKHGYSIQIRDTLNTFSGEDQEQLKSLLSVFPIFMRKHIMLASISGLNKKNILRISQPITHIDPTNQQTFLHFLAHVRNKTALLRHTELRRSILINAVLAYTSRLVTTRDQNHKIPLHIFLKSLPSVRQCTVSSNYQTGLRHTALLLAIETLLKNEQEYLRSLRESKLDHLTQLFRIQPTPEEENTEEEKSFLNHIPLDILIASLPFLDKLTTQTQKDEKRKEQYNTMFAGLILESALNSHGSYQQIIKDAHLDNNLLSKLRDLLITTQEANVQFNRTWIDIMNCIEDILSPSST